MYREKSTSLVVRLKDASDAKLTVDGRSFHTFKTLSAKNLLRAAQLDRGLYKFVRMTSGLLYKT